MKHFKKISLAVALTLLPLKTELQKEVFSLETLVSQLKFQNHAFASSSLVLSTTNNIRNSIGLAIGYRDNTAYGELACGGAIPAPKTDCTNAPPYNGIIGRLTDIINTLPKITESAGIMNCEQVPETGSITGSDGNGNTVTINFQSPSHHIPSAWKNGGASFQKRVEFSETILGEATKIAYEFNCGDSPATYAAVNMDMGTIDGHAYIRRIGVFTGPISETKKGIEVYMAELSDDWRLRTIDAIRIEYAPASSEFHLWGIVHTTIGSGDHIARTILHGNYDTGVTSILSSGWKGAKLAGADEAIDVTTITNAGGFAASTGLTNATMTAPAYDFESDMSGYSGEFYKRGCVNFSTPDAVTIDNSECAGFPLETTTVAPHIDPTGEFSIHWALVELPGKLEYIP